MVRFFVVVQEVRAMLRWIRRFAFTLMIGTSVVSMPSLAAETGQPEYKLHQVIVMRESGKPERRCEIIAIDREADGTSTYRLKSLDTGEIYSVQRGASGKFTPRPQQATSGQTSVKAPSPYNMRTDPIDTSRVGTDPIRDGATGMNQRPGVNALHPESNRGLGWNARQSCEACKQKSNPQCATCNTLAKRTNPNATPAAPGHATIGGTSKMVVNRSPNEPPFAVGIPMIGGGNNQGPREPINIAKNDQSLNTPDTTPRYQPSVQPDTMVRPATTTPADVATRKDDPRIMIREAIRPSQREQAAEELGAGIQGKSAEARALLVLVAQEDPAPCVRATCIRVLARQGIRDQVMMTVLLNAQQDREPSVREEATSALNKLMKR